MVNGNLNGQNEGFNSLIEGNVLEYLGRKKKEDVRFPNTLSLSMQA